MSGVGEMVTLLSVLADAGVVSISLVIGPSSELMMTPIETSQAEPDTREAVAVLRARVSQPSVSNAHTHGSAIADADLDSADPAMGNLDLY